MAGAGRQLAVVTSHRLILGGEEKKLTAVTSIEPDPAGWTLTLRFRNADPVTLTGPWVPWLSVVLCAGLHGTAFPPGYGTAEEIRVPFLRTPLPALGRR